MADMASADPSTSGSLSSVSDETRHKKTPEYFALLRFGL
jgi:hypothetical protein